MIYKHHDHENRKRKSITLSTREHINKVICGSKSKNITHNIVSSYFDNNIDIIQLVKRNQVMSFIKFLLLNPNQLAILDKIKKIDLNNNYHKHVQ
jgi:hypothetical protein